MIECSRVQHLVLRYQKPLVGILMIFDVRNKSNTSSLPLSVDISVDENFSPIVNIMNISAHFDDRNNPFCRRNFESLCISKDNIIKNYHERPKPTSTKN